MIIKSTAASLEEILEIQEFNKKMKFLNYLPLKMNDESIVDFKQRIQIFLDKQNTDHYVIL